MNIKYDLANMMKNNNNNNRKIGLLLSRCWVWLRKDETENLGYFKLRNSPRFT